MTMHFNKPFMSTKFQLNQCMHLQFMPKMQSMQNKKEGNNKAQDWLAQSVDSPNSGYLSG